MISRRILSPLRLPIPPFRQCGRRGLSHADLPRRARIYNARAMHVTEFDYQLPEALIAQHPAPQRRASRMLRMDGAALQDLTFADLPGQIDFRAVLVLN